MEEYYQERCVPYGLPYMRTNSSNSTQRANQVLHCPQKAFSEINIPIISREFSVCVCTD